MRLFLIRHGHTADTDTLVYSGQRATPLSALGVRQAHALGAHLADAPFAAIFTSDLPRARATADLIAALHGLTPQPRSELREIAMGVWEGKTYAQLAQHDQARLEQWIRDPENITPPGGESAWAVRQRVRRVLRHQIDEYQGRTVAWITHGGVISVLVCDLLGMPITQRWRLHCDPASITTVELFIPHANEHDAWDGSVRSLNDTHHLAAFL